MHYAIVTYGSRGDVQPYVALALGLIERGHKVTLLAPVNFKDFVEGYGVTFYPIHGNLEEIVQSPDAVRMLRSGNIVSFLRFMQLETRKIQQEVDRDIAAGCAGADALVANVLCLYWVHAIAEKVNKKMCVVQVSLPATTTNEFPFAGLAFFNSPSYNRLTYQFIDFVYWQLNKKAVNQFRASLDLAPLKKSLLRSGDDQKILNLYAISPTLCKRPADWSANNNITGFLSLPTAVRETHPIDKTVDGLAEWLEEGDKPIYIGFGSIPVPDPHKFSDILNYIITDTNLRIIFCTGWSQLTDLPSHPNLFVTKYANHQWLLPQCKAAVIHGGAGTTATVLKAKIPVIIVSILADQPWWGKVIAGRQLGTHIPFKKLTTERLLTAIKLSQTAVVLKNAVTVGESMNQEHGVKVAVDLMEGYFADSFEG